MYIETLTMIFYFNQILFYCFLRITISVLCKFNLYSNNSRDFS